MKVKNIVKNKFNLNKNINFLIDKEVIIFDLNGTIVDTCDKDDSKSNHKNDHSVSHWRDIGVSSSPIVTNSC